MAEHIRIDREYGFIDTWTLTRAQLEALNLGVVIGRGVRGELTLIPFGVSVDECYQKVTALLKPPAQLITQPSTPVFVGFESSHAQKRTKGLENTGAIGVKTLENTDKARAEKTVKDEKRLLDQLSLTHSLLQANANLSTSELAQRLGVSRPTARKLLNLDRQGIIDPVAQTLTATQNESGLSSVERRQQPLTDQPSTATDTATRDYTFPHHNGQPSLSLS